MKIAVLTSSRADYGIYQPLLKRLSEDPFFKLELIVFGTHLSKNYGMIIKQIKQDGFPIGNKVKTLPISDSPKDISSSISKTISGFAKIWSTKKIDLVLALGDRYEMFAAVSSSVPFNIPVAHIHGGETTLGAIDNVFRNAITCMSKIHFTAAEPYKKRVIELTGTEKNVYNVGALSIDSIKSLNLLTISDFKSRYGIDLSVPTILVTFHPETVGFNQNESHIRELISAMREKNNYQYVITMPNADTMGLLIRKELNKFITQNKNAIGIESFGSLGYLSCMKHCKMMLGNSSSGFIEASYFQKPVINLGRRQEGRIVTPNIFNCPITNETILQNIDKAALFVPQDIKPIYGTGGTAEKIIKILKNIQLHD